MREFNIKNVQGMGKAEFFVPDSSDNEKSEKVFSQEISEEES